MNSLVKHIEAINAKTQAWIDEDPGNRWAGMITTDLDHWADYGVYTVADYERYQLEMYIYEGHKNAFGCKGRHYDFKSMSLEELQKEADYISKAANEAFEAEKAAEARDLAEFKALVQKTIDLGAGDEETALRWLTSDEKFFHSQDVESWVWDKGILFTDYGKELVKKLDGIVTYEPWTEAA